MKWKHLMLFPILCHWIFEDNDDDDSDEDDNDNINYKNNNICW